MVRNNRRKVRRVQSTTSLSARCAVPSYARKQDDMSSARRIRAANMQYRPLLSTRRQRRNTLSKRDLLSFWLKSAIHLREGGDMSQT